MWAMLATMAGPILGYGIAVVVIWLGWDVH